MLSIGYYSNYVLSFLIEQVSFFSFAKDLNPLRLMREMSVHVFVDQ